MSNNQLVTELYVEIDELRTRIMNLGAENEELRDECAAHVKTIKVRDDTKHLLHASLKHKREKLAALSQRHEELQSLFDSLLKSYTLLHHEIQMLREQLAPRVKCEELSSER